MPKPVINEQSVVRKKQKRKVILGTILLLMLLSASAAIYHYLKPLPEGISYEGDIHSSGQVEFLYDLTYENEGNVTHNQVIFDQIETMIDEADDFILIDMFLFNDEYDRSASYPALSRSLMEALIDKKQQDQEVDITVITDRINTFYGSYPSEIAEELEEEGVKVVFTDLKPLRDSNPFYSGGHRTFLQWFGTSGSGWIPNAFSPDSPDVTLRSYLDLLNFKANHRKVVVNEKEGLVTSANPHDGSSLHSNIAFVVKGEILRELVQTEKAVADLSGADVNLKESAAVFEQAEAGDYDVQLLTEGKIKKHLLDELKKTKKQEKVTVGAFYLSDRDIVKELLAASKRGAEIKLILDANKDAFGREKNGVPNRPVAHELVTESDQKIQVRWYKTNGEQYHTKLVFFERNQEDTVIGGSANFTKRNLGDFNLETDLKITGPADTGMMKEIEDYFHTIWNNESGTYTEDYEVFADDSFGLRFLYRFQEWSGISSF
ncbi:phospholipase D family protein [Metabacillus idriensis]|uniref:phospholipase D family protein n=1 Tax=Metabacillus idriensis TaxID=324768 RepID=UPI00281489C1|nr:phospholipase D family protein [Metabacillus idriensis]MDR0136597.1 phospholipase D family protein [Metabacillus idriensis]